MKYIGRDLLIFLISLFIFSGCQNSDEVGLDVKPSDQITGTLVDTTTVKTTTVLEEPFLTKGLVQHPLGLLNDPELGETESNLAIALTLPPIDLKLRNLPVLDSAILVLKYGGEFYGTSGVPYTVNVHQLNEKIRANGTYYNTKEWQYNSEIIGSQNLTKFDVSDSIRIVKRRTGKSDTVITTAPQLRIPLSTSFIVNTFFNSDTANFRDNARFNNFFKGLYVTIERNSTTNGMVLFDFQTDTISGLDLYYKTVNGTTIDTISTHFSTSKDSTVASIKHRFSAKVQSQLNNPGQKFDDVYVQPLGGLRTKVTFPYLNKLNAIGNIIVNKAELIVTPADGSDAVFGVAPRLIFYRTDISEQRQFLPDNDGIDPRTLSDADFGGYYDAVNKRYVFTVTSYIQDILSGKLQQYDAYLAPIFPTSTRANLHLPESTGSNAARSILNSGSSSSPYKMKLNIIYTKLNL